MTNDIARGLVAASVAAVASFLVGTARAAPTPLPLPLLPAPTEIGLAVTLQDFVVLPKHSDGSAARIQFLEPASDGTTDLIALDEAGIVYRISADGTRVTTYLDLRTQGLGLISTTSEEGLVGIAFHPNFAGDPTQPGYGKFYTAFSADRTSGTPDFKADADQDHHQVIREWTASDPKAPTFSGTSREVLRVGKYASNHNGGTIRFNPNARVGMADYGKLYIGFGDGGGGNDPLANGQDETSPLGKILRIDPLQAVSGAKYTVPADNPFVSRPGAAPLVWAYGFRNPQQFSFTSGDSRLFVDDIGQNNVEEVDVVVRGGNYGWQVREGTFATGTGVGSTGGVNDYNAYAAPKPDATSFIYPVAQYDHSDDARDGGIQAAAIGSGFYYLGSTLKSYRGLYIFSESVQGRLMAIDAHSALPVAGKVYAVSMRYGGVTYQSLSGSPLGEGNRSDLRLGVDRNGELYALLKGPGAIYKVVKGP